ncbi:hypothetical protein IE53DRAFT_311777 [Violaceomyces palustris]|uniref:Uncharacterized protein n=1 Tax=Violaceomyces palustris TaxID=1673888 RepID=A0ACD0P3P2_9BASI|nr:hypothetical protein IE53DRAFT_311777 [Violaceomyces palustris]
MLDLEAKGQDPASDRIPPLYQQPRRNKARFPIKVLLCFVAFLTLYDFISYPSSSVNRHTSFKPSPNPHIAQTFRASLDKCARAQAAAGPPPDFAGRKRSDRFEEGTPLVIIRNATVWTGDEGGTEVRREVDVFLDGGIIKKISRSKDKQNYVSSFSNHVKEIDAKGKWLTPGVVDMHVHLSDQPVPDLDGSVDNNSIGNNINPYLRSIDSFNQHDPSFKRALSGGITSTLVLPGSANSLGGQAYPIKLRSVSSGEPSGRLIDPPLALTLNGEANSGRDSLYLNETGMVRHDASSSFRHMKMACGENPRRVYRKTRMDEAWDFRKAFDQARELKNKQDSFCEAAKVLADTGSFAGFASEEEATFPDDLSLEALVDVLRGKVKVNTHCYTSNDFESYIRHSNEFRFPVASFHHATEAYLTPELFKKAYGPEPPAIALFSTNMNYKLEAYFGSPFNGAILASHNITPIYKSDHPVTDSRRVINQAGQAHHFGLSESDALKSVITAPAEALGLGHRIGYVKEGHDADLVLWNTHPLRLGSTPEQVIIDGIPQLEQKLTPSPSLPSTLDFKATSSHKSEPAPPAPPSGDYAKEIERVKNSTALIQTYETKAFPIASEPVSCALLKNVKWIFYKAESGAKGKVGIKSKSLGGKAYDVVVEDGEIICEGTGDDCARVCKGLRDPDVVLDTKGGTILPGLTSYGSNLGLTDIVAEYSTSDGDTLDPTTSSNNEAANTAAAMTSWPLVRAVDGLHWGGHDLLRARASGITTAIVMPQSDTFFSGLSTRFDTGAKHGLDGSAAIRQEEVAMHVTLNHFKNQAPSISEQVGLLRQILKGAKHGSTSEPSNSNSAEAWGKVIRGQLPLVVTALSSDQIVTLLKLKDEFPTVKLVLSGATESHLVADEIAKRDVGVLLIPQTWMRTWDELKSLPGPPLTKETTLSSLIKAGVKVGLKIEEGWMASNLLWDATRAALETDGQLVEEDVVALISSNLDEILDLKRSDPGLVAFDGSPFEYGSKVLAVAGPRGVEVVP